MGFLEDIKKIGGGGKTDAREYSGGSESADKDAEELFKKEKEEPDIEAGRSKVDLNEMFAPPESDIEFKKASEYKTEKKEEEKEPVNTQYGKWTMPDEKFKGEEMDIQGSALDTLPDYKPLNRAEMKRAVTITRETQPIAMGGTLGNRLKWAGNEVKDTSIGVAKGVILAPVEGAIELRKGVTGLKAKWNEAELGGIQEKVVDAPHYGMMPIFDKNDQPVLNPDGSQKMKKTLLGYTKETKRTVMVPVKKGKTWTMEEVEATPQNIQMAVQSKRQKENEVKLGREYVAQKEAETANIKSVTAMRDYRLARAQEPPSLLPQRDEKYRVRKGFTPNFNVPGQGSSGYVRDRYMIGGVPGVENTLERGRSGLRNMSARVLSNYSAPITPNPQLRMQLPNVFAPGTSLAPESGGVLQALSPSNVGGGAVLAKLQPNGNIGILPSTTKFGSGGISFGNMRSMGSRILGGGKKR